MHWNPCPGSGWHWLCRMAGKTTSSGTVSFADKQKFYRRLVNRGFTHDQAMDALNQSR